MFEMILRSVLARVIGRLLDMIDGSWVFFCMRMVCVSDHEGGGGWPCEIRLARLASMKDIGEIKCL